MRRSRWSSAPGGRCAACCGRPTSSASPGPTCRVTSTSRATSSPGWPRWTGWPTPRAGPGSSSTAAPVRRWSGRRCASAWSGRLHGPRPRRPGWSAGGTRGGATAGPSPTTTTSATTSTRWSSGPPWSTPAPYWRRPGGADPGGGAARQARPGLPQAGPAPRHAAAGRRLRLGVACDPRGPHVRRRASSASPCRRSRPRCARKRRRRGGLTDRVEIRVQDYRDVTDGPFDAICSHRHGRARRRARAARRTPRTCTGCCAPGGRLLNHAIARRPGPRRTSRTRTSFIDALRLPRRRAARRSARRWPRSRRPASRSATWRPCASTTR